MRTLPLNRRYSRGRFSHGGIGAARWLQLRRGRRDNVISYIVSPIVSISGKEGAKLVFELERLERREFGARTRKA